MAAAHQSTPGYYAWSRCEHPPPQDILVISGDLQPVSVFG